MYKYPYNTRRFQNFFDRRIFFDRLKEMHSIVGKKNHEKCPSHPNKRLHMLNVTTTLILTADENYKLVSKVR